MSRCSYCGRLFADDEDTCPDCERFSVELDSASDDGSDRQWVPIARFANAAEAGYFGHELMQHDEIPTTIIAADNFDALGGYWSTRYVLSVPESLAEPARSAFRALIERAEAEEGDDEFAGTDDTVVASMAAFEGFETSAEPPSELARPEDSQIDDLGEFAAEESPVNWVPIMLTLAAGGVAFWMAREFHEQPKPAVLVAPAGQEQEDLWEYLSRDPRPWIQRSDNHRGIRELSVDPERDLVIIREDADGDGVFEKELPFRPELLHR